MGEPLTVHLICIRICSEGGTHALTRYVFQLFLHGRISDRPFHRSYNMSRRGTLAPAGYAFFLLAHGRISDRAFNSIYIL